VTNEIHIGTSGFTAAGWPGSFYPKKLPARDFLNYYSHRFGMVELMSTLYGPPALSTVENWYSQTPEHFIFSIKMPRKITHEKALDDCSRDVTEFFRVLDHLKEKLGPILLKFNGKDMQRYGDARTLLERLLRLLDSSHSYRFAVSVPVK
jgi:uncharacterized protein YecE (DUF72 family)